jgi:hypothetical protein
MEQIIFKDEGVNFGNIKEFINKNNIRIILFAETHGLINELEVQEEIIKNSKPSVYLYELLEEESLISKEDFDNFLSRSDEEDFSIISKFSDLKLAIKMARKFGIPIIGCDIKDMLRKNTRFREPHEISKSELKEEEKIMEEREKKQIEIINKYLNSNKNLLFVSIGAYHLRKNSPIFKSLKSNYLLVYPLFDGKEIGEINNPLNHEVVFCIKSNITKNGKKS